MRSIHGNSVDEKHDLEYKFGEQLTNLPDYLNYVHAVLDSIPEDVVVRASYDTGFGITLTDEHLGDSPMTLFVVQHRVVKVLPPKIKDSDEWDDAWKKAKELIHSKIEKAGA